MRRLSWMGAIFMVVAGMACTDDSGGGGQTDASVDRGTSDRGTDDTTADTTADIPTLDQNVGDSDDEASAGLCEAIGPAANVGSACDPNDTAFCGQGGICATFEEGGQTTCYQACSPPTCDGLCTGESDTCQLIVDQDGNQIPIDAENFPGANLGVCGSTPEGDVPAYGQCDPPDSLCVGGNTCLTLQGTSNEPYCSPTCSATAECTAGAGGLAACAEGTIPTAVCVGCVLGQPATNCAILCPEAEIGTTGNCPNGMECVDTGQGVGICLFPSL